MHYNVASQLTIRARPGIPANNPPVIMTLADTIDGLIPHDGVVMQWGLPESKEVIANSSIAGYKTSSTAQNDPTTNIVNALKAKLTTARNVKLDSLASAVIDKTTRQGLCFYVAIKTLC